MQREGGGGSGEEKGPLSKRRLTICVVGSGGVGKSSLTIRFLKGVFSEFYDPTVEECYVTQYEYGFDTLDMEIIDTAGEEEFMMFRDCSLARADAFLALFALNSRTSFRDLKGLISKIIREHDDDDSIPIVVLANKRDLEEVEVDFPELLEYCNRMDLPLLETSAKTGLNVKESVRLLIDRTVQLKPHLVELSRVRLADKEPSSATDQKCIIA